MRTIIIGGGISGLCTAFYLARQHGPGSVLVLEASGHPGGTARTEIVDGAVCEWGPNGFLDREPRTLEWARALNLTERLLPAHEAAAHRFLLKNGRLEELIGPPGFLLSPLLSLRGRARLLCEPFISQRTDPTEETIWAFAARRIGAEAADTLVASMVLGVFGGDARELSLGHCFPRMAAMECEHGTLFRAMKAKAREARANATPGQHKSSPMGPGGTLTSFPRGMGELTGAATAALGDSVRLGIRATSVTRENAQYRVHTAQGETFISEQLVLATPAYAAADLIAGLDPEAARACAQIPYAPINVLCAAYRREDVGNDLNGFGFLVPRSEGRRVLGCIWSSSVFPAHAPEGWVLLRVMFGGAVDPEAIHLTDSEIIQLFMREVAPLLRITREPEWTRQYRYERGIPQYTLGHGTRLGAIEAAEKAHPGLAFANNAYWGVGVNDCVVTAHRAVKVAMTHQ